MYTQVIAARPLNLLSDRPLPSEGKQVSGPSDVDHLNDHHVRFSVVSILWNNQGHLSMPPMLSPY